MLEAGDGAGEYPSNGRFATDRSLPGDELDGTGSDGNLTRVASFAQRWLPASVWQATGIRLDRGSRGKQNGDDHSHGGAFHDGDADYDYDDGADASDDFDDGRDDELLPLQETTMNSTGTYNTRRRASSSASARSTNRVNEFGLENASYAVGSAIASPTYGDDFGRLQSSVAPATSESRRTRRRPRGRQPLYGRGSLLGRLLSVFSRSSDGRPQASARTPFATSSSIRKSPMRSRLFAFARAHPFIALALFLLALYILRPFWFYLTHWSWGFVVYPFPSAHHGFGWLHRNPRTRPWILAWDGTRPVRPWREGEPFPPPLPPFSLIPWRHSLNSRWNDFLEFPMQKIVQAPSMYEWEVPRLTKPKRRPRRRLGEPAKTSGRLGLPRGLSRGDAAEAMGRNVTLADLVVADPSDESLTPAAIQVRHPHHPPHHHEDDTCSPRAYWSDPRDLTSPAMLAIHAFSTARPKDRPMRDVLREHQRRRVPWRYMHLLDFQFVICSPPSTDIEAWARLSAEQEQWGDLLLLDELATSDSDRMKENGDDGKTYRWMREVVARALDGRGREALWVMKTDIDSYHILPNLLDWVVDELPPTEPSFFGSSFGTSWQNKHYFQGLGYGFSWSVLRTLVAADLSLKQTLKYEDHRTGSFMFSLPARPGATAPRFVPETIEAWSPPSPDAHTGLIRADMFERAGSWYYWWLPQDSRTIIAHGMKNKKVSRSKVAKERDCADRSRGIARNTSAPSAGSTHIGTAHGGLSGPVVPTHLSSGLRPRCFASLAIQSGSNAGGGMRRIRAIIMVENERMEMHDEKRGGAVCVRTIVDGPVSVLDVVRNASGASEGGILRYIDTIALPNDEQ